MHRILTALVALCLPATAWAASWEFIANCGEANQLRIYSFDPASVRRDGDQLLLKMRGDYSRLAGSRAREARMEWAFDCARKYYVERSRTEFGTNGAVTASYAKPTAVMGINRNSVAAKVHARLCS